MIKKIKDNINNNIGSGVKIIYNGSRNKKEEFSGVIKEVYSNIFVIKLENDEIKSFSYSDVLTKTVEIFFDKL